MRRLATAATVAAAALAWAGCGGEPEGAPRGPDAAPPAPAADAFPDALRLAAAPAGAVPVGDAKRAAKEGDEVVIRGRIGGGLEPMAATRAVMTVADPSLVACDAMGGEDHCPTPWDYCCESPENLTANSATVEVVGADGRALRAALRGWNGLQPLKTVVVKGVVGPRPAPGVFVVRATGIFVE